MIKIQGKFEDEITGILTEYMQAHSISSKSEAVLAIVKEWKQLSQQLSNIRERKMKQDMMLDRYKYSTNQLLIALENLQELHNSE